MPLRRCRSRVFPPGAIRFWIALVVCGLALMPGLLLPPSLRARAVRAIAPETHVDVTTTADAVDGATSSLADLNADPGPDSLISLREALLAAEATAPGPELTIGFALQASPLLDQGYDLTTNTWVITLSADPDNGRLSAMLPELTRGKLKIDGSSQPGITNRPAIIIDGFDVVEDPAPSNGIVITSAENTIVGLALINFYNSSVVLKGSGAKNNRITGSTIGISPRGVPLQPGYVGVELYGGANQNVIGGPALADHNIIVGNENAGVQLSGSGTNANLLAGNWIGLDYHSEAFSNVNGVLVRDGAEANQIGAAGQGNVISGNHKGILLLAAQGNHVSGNLIGLAADGTTPLGNSEGGIFITNGAHHNTIGGVAPGARNIIAANEGQGIYIAGDGSDANQVQGNYIGVDAGGLVPRGNLRQGILVAFSAEENLIGGEQPGEGNIITYNGLGGVRLDSAANIVTGNLIGLAADGVTPLGNQNNGIRVGGNNNIIGPNNIIAHNQVSGIIVSGSNTLIQNNRLESNATSGVCVTGTGTQILANQILGNGRSGPTSPECEIQSGIIITGTSTLVSYNVIRDNWVSGIAVYQGHGNSIRANSISDNQQIGILLQQGGNDAITPPVITTITSDKISGQACSECVVDLFTDSANQGKDFLGDTKAGPDGAFVLTHSTENLVSMNITATHTDAHGNTSPFADAVTVLPPAPTFSISLPLVTLGP